MEFFFILPLVMSIVALVYANRARKEISRVISIIENGNYTTVTIDHTDGRITVLQRQYGSAPPAPPVI